MISTFTVLVDANVFFGARLRSLVLTLAQTKMFRARWTERIHDEWMRNVAEKQNLPIEKLARTRAFMDAAVLNCLVGGYEQLETSFVLPDPDDRHVVAAAVKTRADLILTFNRKDFPPDILEPLGLATQHPDDFLQDMFGISTELFIEAVREDFRHYLAPPLSFDAYVASLARSGVSKTAALIGELRVLIEGE